MTHLAQARRPAAPLALASRASGARRRRRQAVNTRLYCGTNGCTTTLHVDPTGGLAVCPICGFHRRLA